ncbi:phenolic acid decarboxylase [Epilithonimonas sp. JDS]|uniref:phenolic acid decarboxylase n=1 Tax=Epilithonimonas sp. JDS TaxID=2902797 RepID=UPI001E505532|nr:phenolic acid decarboxylase [Epilithonimonas sp. JDS]MCD9856817.1 phenolic acid decarboxylase [Epilithonimonas sp. JDS]
MKKNVLMLLAFSIFLTSCSENKRSKSDNKILNEKKVRTDVKGLIGKTYEFNYAEKYVYHIKFKSDSTVQWKLVKGEFPGTAEETDKYIATQISEDILFVSWVEESGFGYCNVMDFNTNNLTTHARHGNSVFVNPGKFKEVK